MPTDQLIRKMLCNTHKYFEEINILLESKYGDLVKEWKYYGQKNEWLLKTLKGKRNLYFFKPYNKYFLISFVLGDKAVSEITQINFPKEIVDKILASKKYAEGRGLQIKVKNKSDVELIIKLVAIKLDN